MGWKEKAGSSFSQRVLEVPYLGGCYLAAPKPILTKLGGQVEGHPVPPGSAPSNFKAYFLKQMETAT